MPQINPKIIHVSTPDSWRGGEQQMIYLLEELHKKGIEQCVVCPAGSAVSNYLAKTEIRYVEVEKGFKPFPKFAKSIHRLCTQEGYNLIHTHDSGAHTHAITAAALFGNTTPIVVSRRVDFPIKNSPLSIWKYNHKNVARILCVSDTIKAITSQRIKNKSVLKTVYSGIDLSRFEGSINTNKLHSEFKIDEDVRLVGNVAAIAPHKDYFTFVNAAELILQANKKVHFFIVGDGPMSEEIKSYVSEKKLNDFISFTGFRKDIPEILPELDLFLFTSETEGLGTSLLDAFACKVPVVGTSAGGATELIIPEKTGLLCGVKDAAQLAENATRLLNDDRLKQQLVEGASDHLQAFTKQHTAKSTLAEYFDILN